LTVKVGGKPHGAVFEALEGIGRCYFALEPAERLGGHGPGQEADDVELQDLVLELVVEIVAAAIVHPTEEGIGVPTEGWARAEERESLVLTIPIGGDAVAAVEDAGMDGVLELEGRHDRAGGENVDLQTPSRHVVHAFGEIVAEFVEDVPVRPGRLEFPCGRLGSGHLRSRNRCCRSQAGNL
jgi:hypothetical protein